MARNSPDREVREGIAPWSPKTKGLKDSCLAVRLIDWVFVAEMAKIWHLILLNNFSEHLVSR
jgi:hypothetical protein